MNHLLFTLSISALILTLTGCSPAAHNRESNPEKFKLLNSGQVKKENVLQFKNCLIERYEVRDRLAYPVKTKHHVRDDGHRVEGYAGIYLMFSTDIFNSGKTQFLRVENSALIDLDQQIAGFDTCLNENK